MSPGVALPFDPSSLTAISTALLDINYSVYSRGGQTIFGHGPLKIYFTFEDRKNVLFYLLF